MHLALICNEYPPSPHGGIGSFSHDLAEGLVEAGHKVTVVGVYAGESSEKAGIQNGVTVVRLPATKLPWHRPKELWNRFRLKRWLAAAQARERFDLLEVPDYEGWLPCGSFKNLPVIATLHGSNLFFDAELGRKGYPFEHELERKTVVRADFLRGFSRYAFDRTLMHCQLSGRKGQVIYHAVDTGVFAPGPEPAEPGLIAFVNTVNAKKGAEQLVEAANLIFPSRPNARMVLIGGSKPGADANGQTYIETLRQKVHPEFRGRVEFLGRMPRSEIIPWLRKASVCCYPSHMETFGIAPVEAMSVGRPTIYSRTGPGPEVVEDGVSGLLCDPSDPKDIAAKIRGLLDQRDYAEKLGKAARLRVLERFDKAKWIAANVEFYTDCLAEFKTRHA